MWLPSNTTSKEDTNTMNWYAGGKCKHCYDPISELEPGICRECQDKTDKFGPLAHFIGPDPVDHLFYSDTPKGNAEALVIYYINNVQVYGDRMHWHADTHDGRTEEFYAFQQTIRDRFVKS